MKAEDLFEAIGGVESYRLERSEISSRKSKKEENTMKQKSTKRIHYLLIAAVLIMLLSITAFAALNGRIQLDVQRWKGHSPVDEAPEGTYNLEIGFHPTGNEYIELGSCYPQHIPGEYHRSFVSEKANGLQIVVYSDSTGKEAIRYMMTSGGAGRSVGLGNIEKEESVEIHGIIGTRYYQDGGLQSIAWADEENGYGYMLISSVPDLDLLPIALSVGPGEELTATNSPDSAKAFAELGDYRITALPEGFMETECSASPLENGGGWYAYVRRMYGNKITTDSMIYFEYEHFTLESDEPMNHPIEQDDKTPDTIIAYKGGGEKITIQGMPGAVSEDGVIWVDWEAQVVFRIVAAGRTNQELIQLAESVNRF